LNFIPFLILIFFYPRLMVAQVMFKLEKSTVSLERMANNAQKMVIKTLKKKPDKKNRASMPGGPHEFLVSQYVAIVYLLADDSYPTCRKPDVDDRCCDINGQPVFELLGIKAF